MSLQVRPLLDGTISEDEAFDLILRVDGESFDESPPEEALGGVRALAELDRSVIAWDGGEAVGCGSIYSLDLSVPGGSVPTAGVTWIGMRPTHRRLGGMRGVMDALHEEIRARDHEPIAALWASQPPLYGRFGYGWASSCLSVVVEKAHGTLSRAPRDSTLRARLVEPQDDHKDTQGVYDTVRGQRPGMPDLTSVWHTRITFDPKGERAGAGPLHTVVVEDDAGVRGYARYSFKHQWSEGYADGKVSVRQVLAVDPAAEAALWRFLIDFDLSGRVDAWNLPIDIPLQWWLDQPRHHKQQPGDALYLKVMDLPAAVTRRTYARAADVVVDVRDDSCPWNAGRWRLSVDLAGAECEKATDAADISVDVSSLGAAYLGGPTLVSHLAAGWIDEHTPGSVQALSDAFVHPQAPWSPFVF